MALAVALLLIAGVLHAWYGGNAATHRANAAPAFRSSGPAVLGVTILLLLAGLVVVANQAGWVGALVAAGVYFLVLPLVIVPALHALGFIPDKSHRE